MLNFTVIPSTDPSSILAASGSPLPEFGHGAPDGASGRGKHMIEASAPPRRPVIVWDLVFTIVLLVVMVGAALLASFFSFFLAFASDSCGAVTCDTDRIATGMLVAMIGPLLAGLLALVAAVVVLVLKRIAFWIPIVGIVLIVGVFVGGAAITASGVPSAMQ
jgi:uncharacterized BrkB/YihY/UPF0761 family membrane protein